MRVLDISLGIAGAYCAQLLTLLGAEVIRLELGGAAFPPSPPRDAVIQAFLDRGKRRVDLDLGGEDGRARLFELVSLVDALVDDAGPDGLAERGLYESDLLAQQPSLILTRVSEFGLDGPWSAWHGSELVDQAAGGLLFLTGTWDRPPVQLAPHQVELTTGLLAAIATAAMLYGGGPATIDIAKQEAVLAMISPSLTNYAYTGVVDAREGTVAGMTRIEHAADTWVYAGPSSPGTADYTSFAAFLGIPELAEPRFATPDARMEHWQEHQDLIVPRIRERTAAEWTADAAAARLTFGPVQTTRELLECPVLNERDFFSEMPTESGLARAPLAPYLVDGHRPAAFLAATDVTSATASTSAED